jgi:hypothetical protein
MGAIARSEELKSCEFLIQFLINEDQKDFTRIQKNADKIKPLKSIEDLSTIAGEIEV